MILQTDNLLLTPFGEKEISDNYVNWLNDKEVCKFNSHGDTKYTKEMAYEFLNYVKSNKALEAYAVYIKEGGVHIGNISLQNIDLKNNSCEIAYLFGEKKYWGKGYATQAGEILIKHAFEDLKMHRIYFGTHIENIGMQKVGEKLGFKKEGVFVDAQYKNGKYNDIVRYGLIKE